MSSKPHADDNNIRIEYTQDKVEKFLNKLIYKQVKKMTGISAGSSVDLLRILDNHTLNSIEDINNTQGRLSCIKRKNVRAILIKPNNKLFVGKNDQLIIGTNSIEKTEKNNRGNACPRMVQGIDSTKDKLLCAVSCNHLGCAEKNLMNMATSFGVDLFNSKIILFGHTGGPCASCCQTLAEKGIKAVIIGSPPEPKQHKDYDKSFATSGYKVFITPGRLLRREKDKQ